MEYGICLLSVVPVRAAPTDQSEMVTQLLFGNMIQVTGHKDNWINVRIIDDGYEGWLDRKQIQQLSNDEFETLRNLPVNTITELVGVVESESNGQMLPVVFGSQFRNTSPGIFSCSGMSYTYEGESFKAGTPSNVSRLLLHSRMFVGSPYLWGGKSPFGIDCSGFVQVVFLSVGIDMLRDASQQATQGEQVSLIDEAKPGDLLFFDNEEGIIIHVGILMEDMQIIHASGEVRIDPVDHQGIYNRALKKYTHKLRIIKRIL